MNLNEYQNLSTRTMDPALWPNQALTNYGMGLIGEAAEVLDHLKKVIFHGHSVEHDKVREELGDVLFYLSAIASTLGIELNGVAQKNVDKLKKRYPTGFSKARSINREE